MQTCAALTVSAPRSGTLRLSSRSTKSRNAEQVILECLQGVKGRGKSGMTPELLEKFDAAVLELERAGGIQAPTASPQLEGRWKLLFTTRPGTASPIQRTFTGVESFVVYQEILLSGEQGARVYNIVKFGRLGELKAEAEAITDSQPMEGFTPRKGPGIALFGKSSVNTPAAPDLRIDFQFDRAAFDFKLLPFKVPYPVPFKLLGDETKGWLDITYLSADGTFRLSRGNKGTLFVLTKDPPAKQRLLSAIANGDDEAVLAIAEELAADCPESKPATSGAAEGKWRLRWSAQAEDANFLQKKLSGQLRNYQIIGGSAGRGRLENLVELGVGIRVRALAACEPSTSARTSVYIDELRLEVGGLRLPFPIKLDRPGNPGYVDWLYLDEDLRITRGNKGSIFVHTRERDEQ
ncbi:hypothetical protein WJX72_007235 [[Myrmecia] bisecta]|uniref:Plastid lipid-associated protein/fibrillin conserved domain-containing protein n=1 Tax=[Myrmecia] bisecta TaxID=41462 RepID=A0AAW1QFQ7_9CHLO